MIEDERRFAVRLTKPATYAGRWLGRKYVDSRLEPVEDTLMWWWSSYEKAAQAAEDSGFRDRAYEIVEVQHNDGSTGGAPMSEQRADTERIMQLRWAGCICPVPLLGERPGVGSRCRLCNVVADLNDGFEAFQATEGGPVTTNVDGDEVVR